MINIKQTQLDVSYLTIKMIQLNRVQFNLTDFGEMSHIQPRVWGPPVCEKSMSTHFNRQNNSRLEPKKLRKVESQIQTKRFVLTLKKLISVTD